MYFYYDLDLSKITGNNNLIIADIFSIYTYENSKNN